MTDDPNNRRGPSLIEAAIAVAMASEAQAFALADAAATLRHIAEHTRDLREDFLAHSPTVH